MFSAILVGIVLVGAAFAAFLVGRSAQMREKVFEEAVNGEKGSPKLSFVDARNRLATSMARFETGFRGNGFPLDASKWQGRAAKNNNPGNLRFIGQQGATGADDASYAKFPNEQIGWEAMLADIGAKMSGRTRTTLGPHSTLEEFVTVYAPPFENPTESYVDFVSRELGVRKNATFREWVQF